MANVWSRRTGYHRTHFSDRLCRFASGTPFRGNWTKKTTTRVIRITLMNKEKTPRVLIGKLYAFQEAIQAEIRVGNDHLPAVQKRLVIWRQEVETIRAEIRRQHEHTQDNS